MNFEELAMATEPRQPSGSLLMRTLAMPSDTNPSGDIFGGWLLSQMDLGGAILAKEMARGRVVTVAADATSFLRPVKVGDVVCCYGLCTQIGRTSIKVKLEVWIKRVDREPIGQRECVTEAVFTYVAVDQDGKARVLPQQPVIENN